MATEWNAVQMVDVIGLTIEDTMERIGSFLESTVIASLGEGQPPSKAGKPPHRLTGELIQSIKHATENTGQKVISRVGSGLPYAARLELGFTGKDARGRNISEAPRPFLRPAIYKHKQEIRELVRGSLRLSVKAGRRAKGGKNAGRIRQTRGRI